MASELGRLLLDLAILVAAAKVGGWGAERLRQPAVLGELLVGILLGPSLLAPHLGFPDLGLADLAARIPEADAPAFYATHGADLAIVNVLVALGALGAILLLFEVGLESNIKELAKVGTASVLVAFLGIAVSFVVGYAASWGLALVWEDWRSFDALIPMQLLHVFVGATLTATSVGITARVLGDMGKLRTNESRIILGAAVLDDIGGLLILAVVTSLVGAALGGAPITLLEVARNAGVSVGFLVVSLVVGLRTVPRAFDAIVSLPFRRRIVAATDRPEVPSRTFALGIALAFALAMSYLAELAGLANILGAFTGGLLLAQSKAAHLLFDDLRPIAGLFVGFFFVILGMRVDLTQMEGHTVGVLVGGAALSVLAILAKLSSGLGVVRTRASRLIVGVGMAPRGEVGLIFAAAGLSSGMLQNWQYTMVIVVVLVTTVITPFWLSRLEGQFAADPAGPAATAAKDLGRVPEP